MQNTIHDMRILVIESQKGIRMLVHEILQGMGAVHIFEVEDGDKALRLMDEGFGYIDAIICDWDMPGFAGFEFLKDLRSKAPSVPLMVLAGHGKIEYLHATRESPVTAYLGTPFTVAEFENCLLGVTRELRKVS